MLCIRYSKIIFLSAVALYVTLVAFGNVTDYQTNFEFVKHVMSMDSIFPDSTITYRALINPNIHHIAYFLIIAMEMVIAAAGWYGAYVMFCARGCSSRQFNYSKKWGVIALTLGFILWQVGFMSVGGEWFGMWMSKDWNGVNASSRVFMMLIAVQIYLALPDGEVL